jgi:hypothetical protein
MATEVLTMGPKMSEPNSYEQLFQWNCITDHINIPALLHDL